MKRDTTNPTVATIIVPTHGRHRRGALGRGGAGGRGLLRIHLGQSVGARAGTDGLGRSGCDLLGVVLHRSADARTLVILVNGCGALWTVALGGPVAYMMRDSRGAFLTLAFVVTCSAITGACFGYVCFIRYRGLPPSVKGAVRLATLSAMPGFALFLVAQVMTVASPSEHGHGWSARGSLSEALMVIVAPFLFAVLVSMISIQSSRRGLTKPNPIA